LTVRKIAAAVGEANNVRSLCSSARPRIPAGIVPTTITQASRASRSRGVARPFTERRKPNQIRFQSSKK